jgi:hypothetical protein
VKSVLTILLMLANCSFLAAGQAKVPAKPLTPFEQNLVNAEKGFIEAQRRGDVAFLKHTLADDFSYVGTDGQLADRQGMIDELADGKQNLLPYDMKVVMAGDDVGIVTYDVVVRVPPSEDQGPPPRYQHFSTVWVKQGDMWKMKFHQKSISHWGDW